MKKLWKKGAAALLSAVLAVSGVFSSVTVFADEDAAVMSGAGAMTGPGAAAADEGPGAAAGGVTQTATASDASASGKAENTVSEASASDAFFDEDGVLMDGELLFDLEATVSDAMLADGLIGPALMDFELEDLDEIEFSFDVPFDNDALFAAYVNRAFGIEEPGSHMLRKSVSAYARLTGTEKKLFDCLKADIHKVAEGKRESTQFSYSRDELGIENYVTVETSTSSIGTNDLLAAHEIDLSRVLDALRKDVPYDMYWTAYNGFSYWISRSSVEGKYRLESFNISFPVGLNFRVEENNKYKADTQKTGAVSGAVEKANSILAVYNRPEVSDLKKLIGYRNEIIDLTTYNNDAAQHQSNYYDSGESDPWQLVYVFDNKPETTVVCEGYSKAFKYLCDKTTFNDSTISCYILTGNYAREGSAGGGHMWNAVSFGEGSRAVNYHVDVTHCDNLFESKAFRDVKFLIGVTMNGTESFTLSDDGSAAMNGGAFGASTSTYTFDSSTTSLYSAADRTLSEKAYHFPVYVTSVSTKGQSSIANLQSTGVVYPSRISGDGEVTVIAPTADKYRFLGWYKGKVTDGNVSYTELLSRSYSDTIPVEEECTLVAVYEPESEITLTVTGESFTVNGEAAAGKFVKSYTAGTSVTLAFTGNHFDRWCTSQGSKLSEDSSYSFTLNNDTSVKAESGSSTSGTSLVRFLSASGQTVWSEQWTAENALEKYERAQGAVPYRNGYKFTGWSMTAAQVKAAIESGQSIINVNAQYAADSESCTVKTYRVIDDPGELFNHASSIQQISEYSLNKGAYCTVNAPTYTFSNSKVYYKFLYWAQDPEGTKILSYSKSYKYGVTGNVDLYAIYRRFETETQHVQPVPVVTLEAGENSGSGEFLRHAFTLRFDIPSGYTIVDTGILYDNDNTYSASQEEKFRLDGGAKKASFGVLQDNSITARVLEKGSGVVVRGYVQVQSNLGIQNVYTEILTTRE